MRKVILVLLVSLFSLAFANEITKVGVIDISKVYTRYIKESADSRKIDELKNAYEEEISRRKVEIDKLNRELIKATDDDNQDLVAKLESDITIKKTNLQSYKIYKTKEINALITSDSSKKEFADKVYDEIQRIALQKGYSIIIKKTDPSVYWSSTEIDITDLVIQGLTD